jgi:hypothetical protein
LWQSQKWQESEFLVGLLPNCTFAADPPTLYLLKYSEIGIPVDADNWFGGR